MNTYIIKKVKDIDWEIAEEISVNCTPWETYKTTFNTRAKLLYDDKNIYVQMLCDETNTRAVQTEFNSSVCEDSCMEFFLMPSVKTGKYINFEINPIGTLHTKIGDSRHGRAEYIKNAEAFNIKPTVTKDGWGITYQIPLEILEKHCGKIDKEMKGNFYKCGDKTSKVHYTVWNKVETERPDYHTPQYFGNLIME